MYLDLVVLSGLAIVALMIAFFVGVVVVLRQDALKQKP